MKLRSAQVKGYLPHVRRAINTGEPLAPGVLEAMLHILKDYAGRLAKGEPKRIMRREQDNGVRPI